MKLVINFLSFLVFLFLSLSSFSQQNISTSSVRFTGISYNVHAIIGDSFLGNSNLPDYSVEHSILNGSKEIVLGFSEEKPIGLTAYPNPFMSNLSIQFQDESNYEITIVSAVGAEVKRIKAKTNIDLNLSEIPKGIYILKVVDVDHKKFKVFEVIKL